MGSTNVLWSLDNSDDIFTCHLRLCIWAGEVIPLALLWEMMEFEIIESELVLSDWLVTIEHCHDIVTLFNVSLVHGDRKELTSLEFPL